MSFSFINARTDRIRPKYDVYLTPLGIAKAALELLPGDFIPKSILDPGCGEGVWGKACNSKWNMKSVGVDIRTDIEPKYWNYYSDVYVDDDYLHNEVLYPKDWQLQTYDLIVGNPPYYIAEKFVRESFKYLAPHGYIVFLLRMTFRASSGRYNGLWKEYHPWLIGDSARRPSFTRDRKTDEVDYSVFIWNKDWKFDYYIGKFFSWNYEEEDIANRNDSKSLEEIMNEGAEQRKKNHRTQTITKKTLMWTDDAEINSNEEQ